MKKSLYLTLLTLSTFFIEPLFAQQAADNTSPGSYEVPLGGNTWVSGVRNDRLITKAGIAAWSDDKAVFKTYIYFGSANDADLELRVVPGPAAKLRITLNGVSKDIAIPENGDRAKLGKWKIKKPGYAALELKGLSKSGALFPAITSYTFTQNDPTANSHFVQNNEGNYFYWGRRGPSVHMSYAFPDSVKAEYFYNEITVPKGNDVIGSYYMANGFGEGYFGMQVNGPAERRVLFSVWSPFSTDDPKSIPEDMKIVMLKKGADVHTGEFGNEGSGGQSYLKYNWIAGNTYKFLLKGVPDGDSHTTYTAWFFAPEKNEWMLIASFNRPKTNTYLRRFHSFLENFSPDQGDKERKVLFGNQWIRTEKGQWIELTKGKFTGDNTARKNFRMDYAGGAEANKFFLRNCGFFSDNVRLDGTFERKASGKAPNIDFSKLK